MSPLPTKPRADPEKARVPPGVLGALDELGEAFVLADERGVLMANETLVRLTGYSREELLDLGSPLELLAPTERDRGAAQIAERLAGRPVSEHFETTLRSKDGNEVPIEVAARAMESSEGSFVLAIARDLRLHFGNGARAQVLVDAITDPLFEIDREWRVVLANGAARRRFAQASGRALDAVVGMRLADIFPMFEGSETQRRFVEAMRTREPRHFEDTGITGTFETHAYPTPSGLCVYYRDVTAQRATEHQLATAEERLRHVVATAPIVLFALDPSGYFTLSEGAGLRALGLLPGEVVGRSALEMYDHNPVIRIAIRRALDGDAFTVEVDEAGRHFQVTFHPLPDRGTVAVATDITERHHAEGAIRAASVARPLMRRVVREMIQAGGFEGARLQELGRRLAAESTATTLAAALKSYADMGLGTLRSVEVTETQAIVEASDLVEESASSRATTCHLTLGFLSGIVGAHLGGPALGTEVGCRSRGDTLCRFVVKVREARPAPR